MAVAADVSVGAAGTAVAVAVAVISGVGVSAGAVGVAVAVPHAARINASAANAIGAFRSSFTSSPLEASCCRDDPTHPPAIDVKEPTIRCQAASSRG
jgi:hypothetical protein